MIQKQIELQFGYFSIEEIDQHLSYETHELALKTAIERFKY